MSKPIHIRPPYTADDATALLRLAYMHADPVTRDQASVWGASLNLVFKLAALYEERGGPHLHFEMCNPRAVALTIQEGEGEGYALIVASSVGELVATFMNYLLANRYLGPDDYDFEYEGDVPGPIG